MKMFLLFYALLGCSPGTRDFQESADSATNTAEDAYDTGDTADSAGLDLVPAWWSLSATLVIQDGVPQKSSTLQVMLQNSNRELLCSEAEPIAIRSAESITPPHESILTWWTLEVDPDALICDGLQSPLSSSVLIGIGEMHPDIQAALSSVDGLDSTMPLNGAYFMPADDPKQLFVFGVAGTAEQYNGNGEHVKALPLEDDTWRIEPVYWFSY